MEIYRRPSTRPNQHLDRTRATLKSAEKGETRIRQIRCVVSVLEFYGTRTDFSYTVQLLYTISLLYPTIKWADMLTRRVLF